jgi:HSP20 family protein
MNQLSRYRKMIPANEAVLRDPFFQLVDRFFNDVGAPAKWQANDRPWQPAVDVIETDHAFVATADLPGLKKEEIEIALEDGVLTLSGERKLEHEVNEESRNFKRIERAYGRFSRSFTLPQGVDPSKVEATFADGVLTLTLPKSEIVKARKIAIA